MRSSEGSSERRAPSSSSSLSRTIRGSKAEMISCSTERAPRSPAYSFWAVIPTFAPASTEGVALERTFRSPPWYFTMSVATITFMTERLYKQDPLSPREREQLEDDLIAFCDRELDLLGN